MGVCLCPATVPLPPAAKGASFFLSLFSQSGSAGEHASSEVAVEVFFLPPLPATFPALLNPLRGAVAGAKGCSGGEPDSLN